MTVTAVPDSLAAMAEGSARVTFYRPAPVLRAAILSYCIFRIGRPVRDIVSPEWTNLGWIVAGEWRTGPIGGPLAPVPAVAMGGPQERALIAEGSASRVIAAALTPLGWAQLIGRPAVTFAHGPHPLRDAIGPDCEALLPVLRAASDSAAMDLLDAFFSARLRPTPDDARIARAHALLVGQQALTVDDWAAGVGVSPRQLQRLCHAHFGLVPKRLLRRQRLLGTLDTMRRAGQASWSTVIDAGYVDQAHFVREFRWFMHSTPGAWLRRERHLERVVGTR